MSFTEAIRSCFAKYVTFSGRATRSEYWWFFLFILLGNSVANVLDGALFEWESTVSETEINEAEIRSSTEYQAGPIATVFGLGTLLPNLAAGWRRMHDTGRPGYMLLYPLIVAIGIGVYLSFIGGLGQLLAGDPEAGMGVVTAALLFLAIAVLIISPLLVLWWLTRPSQPGDNEYGPNPNEVLS